MTSARPAPSASAAPATSALPSGSQTPPAFTQLVIAAEQEGDTDVSAITNAMLLGSSFGKEYQVVFQGRVISRPFPDASAFEHSGVVTDFGRWPDDLWAIQPFTGVVGPADTRGHMIYTLRGGQWKKVVEDDTYLYLDLWEAPRGCWFGLTINERAIVFSSMPAELRRVALRCPIKARPLSISARKGSWFLAARGLPDGGIAAIDTESEWLFNPSPPKAPSRLVILDSKGKERALVLPIPPRAAQAKLYHFMERILTISEGALVVSMVLTDKPAPGPDRVLEPYAARCDAAACAPMPLPEMTDILAIEAAEDGALLLAGREAAEAWSLWALPPKGAWQKLGGAPKGWGAASVVALYGSSIDDVWVAVETTTKPVRSALLRSAR